MPCWFFTLWICSALKAFKMPDFTSILMSLHDNLGMKVLVHSAGIWWVLLWLLLPSSSIKSQRTISLVKTLSLVSLDFVYFEVPVLVGSWTSMKGPLIFFLVFLFHFLRYCHKPDFPSVFFSFHVLISMICSLWLKHEKGHVSLYNWALAERLAASL